MSAKSCGPILTGPEHGIERIEPCTPEYRRTLREEIATFSKLLDAFRPGKNDALLAEALGRWPEAEARWRDRSAQALAHQAAREAARIARGLPPISEDELAFDARCEAEWREMRRKYEPTEADLREVLKAIEQDLRREAARGPISRFLHERAMSVRARYLNITFPIRWRWHHRHNQA